MAFPWEALLEKGLAPALTAVGGWAGATLNFKKRLDELEKKVEAKEKEAEKFREETGKLIAQHREELEEIIERLFEQLKDEIAILKEKLERLRDSSTDYAKDAEVAIFISETQTQWQKINRTLGQIEGMLMAYRRGEGIR